MPSSYTSSLRLTLPVQGELSGSWGNTVNTGITQLVDTAVAGTATIPIGAGNYTLTNNNGVTDEARAMFLTLTAGTGAGARNVICPAVSKLYFVTNNTGYAQTVKTASGTGISVPNGSRMVLYCDGTNVVDAVNRISLLVPLDAASGGTGQSSYTVGDILYASAATTLSKLADVATGNALISGGVAVAPSWGKIGLTTHVSGTLPVANGGTGLTAGTSGGILFYSAAGTLASSAALAANALVVGGGAGVAPSTITTGTGVVTALGVNTGTAGAFVVNGGALGTPSSGTVTNLTGTASININGTVGATTPAAGSFTTLSASSTVSGTGFSTYLASPPAIGGTAPAAGSFTTLSASSTVSGAGFSTYLASPPAIGGTAPAAGSFTTLSASSTVSGTGFSTYLASPPAIGGTAPAAGSFTTLSASSTVSGTGFSTYLASPPAIGGTAAAAGSFTTLSASSSVTLSGGTANGVVYLNGSKVVTTGSALTFDGTNFATTGTATATKLIPTGGTATGNGMYLPAANTLAWSNNGAETMRLDSSGNLGLGVTPSAWVSNRRVMQIGGLAAAGIALNGTGAVSEIFANAFRDSGGTYRYFATAPSSYVDFNNSTSGGWAWSIAPSGTAGNAISFTQAMTLDASGNLLVGTTNASVGTAVGCRIVDSGARLEVAKAASTNSDIGLSQYSTGAAAYRFYVGYGGTIYATSTTITAISDQRLKENIRDLDAGLSEVMALKPRKFDWKAGKGKDKKDDRGWIAQEFEQVFPDMVDTWQDPAPEGEEPYKAVNADLIPVLVKAIQEQQAIIADLRARVAALEAR